MTLQLHARPAGPVALVTVTGELDAWSAVDLRRVVGDLIPRNPHVVLDMAGVGFLDCGGIGALVALDRAATDAGGTLGLRGLDPRHVALLDVFGLTDRFGAGPARPTPLVVPEGGPGPGSGDRVVAARGG
ncbi:hypothetical protein NUM3379_36410 [Kineococcus sp. NUM-3379]